MLLHKKLAAAILTLDFIRLHVNRFYHSAYILVLVNSQEKQLAVSSTTRGIMLNVCMKCIVLTYWRKIVQLCGNVINAVF